MTTTTTIQKSQQPLRGKVVSAKMQKTVVVQLTDIIKDPVYKKYLRLSRKIFAHDENSVCKLGDIVLIAQAKPYSKRTAWKVEKVLE